MTLATNMRRANPFNLPNVLTYGRVAAVPIVVACMFWPDEFWMRWVALGIFAIAAITDFFDGYLARVWSQQSTLGQMLDPIADKLLVAATLLMLVADRTINSWSIWAAIVILSREILVSGPARIPGGAARQRSGFDRRQMEDHLATGRHRLPHRRAGGRSMSCLAPSMIGLVLLWIAALLTLYTGWDYFRAGIHHIVDHGA